MPYSVAHDAGASLNADIERACPMETNEAENGTELVTETLVEEVSIDGMCGVY
jgi:mycofactocin precursor